MATDKVQTHEKVYHQDVHLGRVIKLLAAPTFWELKDEGRGPNLQFSFCSVAEEIYYVSRWEIQGLKWDIQNSL